MLETKKSSPVSTALNPEAVIDPTPSMVIDAGPLEAVLDPTPSMMLDVPPLEAAAPALPVAMAEVPVAEAAPMLADIPVAEAAPMLDIPVAEAAPMLADIPVAEAAPMLADVPVAEAAPMLADVPVAEAAPMLADIPVAEAAPVLADIPVAEAAPTLEDIPVSDAAPTLDDIPVSDAAPALAPAAPLRLDVPVAAAPSFDAPAVVVADDVAQAERPDSRTWNAQVSAAPAMSSEPSIVIGEEAPVPLGAEPEPVTDIAPMPLAAAVMPEVVEEPPTDAFDVVVSGPSAVAASPAQDVPFDDLPVVDSVAEAPTNTGFEASLDDLPPIEASPVVQSSSSAFDALAIPPPSGPISGEARPWQDEPRTDQALVATPSPLPASWSAPAAAAPAPASNDQVFASSWEAQPEPAPASNDQVFASNWEAQPEPTPASNDQVFASSWEAPAEPAPAAKSSNDQVFASSWEDSPVVEAQDTGFAGPWDAGSSDDKVELASNAEFVSGGIQSELPTIDVGVSVDAEPFEVESGPAASLANGMSDSGAASSIDDGKIELSTNADFIDAPALTSTGEAWQASGPSIEVDAPEVEGEIIQGIVVEEEPAADAGWGAEVAPPPPARPIDTRVAVPLTAAVAVPVAPVRAPVAPAVAPPVAAARPVQPIAPAIQPIAPAIQPVAPAVQPMTPSPVPQVAPSVQPSARIMADQLFDRSATVKGGGAQVLIRGDHRVILHTMEGQVKRGALKDPDLGAEVISLEGTAGGVESIALGRVKAIFFMLAPGAKSPAGDGQKVRVTFKDGRQVAGFSRDHQQGGPGFFVVPADNRTNTERIFIYRHGVQAVGIEN
jgi:hypothetical protein